MLAYSCRVLLAFILLINCIRRPRKFHPSNSAPLTVMLRDALLDGISSLGIVFFSANVGLDFDRRVLKGLYTKVFVLAFISGMYIYI